MDHLTQAECLRDQYEQTREQDLLIDVADLYRQAMADAGNFTDRIETAKRLATLLVGHPALFPDLSEAIALIDRILAVTPAADPDRIGWSHLLVRARCISFHVSGDIADLDLAFDAAFQSLTTCTTVKRQVSALTVLLVRPLEHLTEQHDWDRLIDFYEQALALARPDDRPWHWVVRPLASALQNRYDERHDLADLDRALTLYQDSLPADEADDRSDAERMAGLAGILMDSFTALGGRDDIDRAVSLYLGAISAERAVDDLFWTNDYPIAAAEALHRRFEIWRDPDDLEAAVDILWRGGMDTHGGSFPFWSHRAVIQAAGYLARECDRTRNTEFLKRALDLLLRAAASYNLEEYFWQYCEMLIQASNLLQQQYQRTGDDSYLEQADTILHDGIARLPERGTAQRRASLLTSVADLYSHWPGRSGQVRIQIDDAVHVLLEGYPETDDPADRSVLLATAGKFLQDQYNRRKDPALLDRAIDCYQGAADAAEHTTDWPNRLSRLATALTRRHDLTGDPSDLERANELRRQAVSAIDWHRPGRQREQTRIAVDLAALLAARTTASTTPEDRS